MTAQVINLLEDEFDDEAIEALGSEDLDDLDEFIEDIDDDIEEGLEALGEEDIESDERRRRRSRRRRTSSWAKQKRYYDRRLRGYATKQEVKSMSRRVSRDVAVVKKAVARNSSRIASGARLDRRQNKAIKDIRKEAENAKQMQMFSMLMGGGDKDYKIASDAGLGITIPQKVLEDAGLAAASDLSFTIPKDTEIKLKEDSDAFESLLPLMMFGGMGGGNGGIFGGDMMSMLVLSKVLDK